MKILFHNNQCCRRGTQTSLNSYAKYCRDVWGYDVRIAYGKNSQWNRQDAIDNLVKEFGAQNIVAYTDFHAEINDYIKNNHIDVQYSQKGGEFDNKLPTGCKTVVHAVFKNHEPHGDVYAYISKWLADVMTQGKSPYVEYPISMVQPTGTLHEELNIPLNALVFCTYGGEDQFNIDYTQQLVWDLANHNPNIYFLFMNINQFCPAIPNIIHLPASLDLQRKANFLKTGSAFLHARDSGESFGAAVAEALSLDIPVISCTRGGDQNHVKMINDPSYMYSTPQELFNIIKRIADNRIVEQPGYFKSKVAANSIENIMETQFKPVFLGEK